ncbi:TRAP transporter large permease subunit [uncultured Thiothrix sp.]|uniref:TRAP transporter large permease n=1 Tax=uncultured Thiothrix sp. TaxID=223185 RepID=UPI0026131551|nr:TRAP transporter large permease subunit [uncultured Thiothrix sp.]HMT94337.1 TRAP transporter large permease subunit [Thiolinea sp.]
MIEFLVANFAPIMFCGLIIFLLMGYSLAFSLGACGLFFGWLAVWAGVPGMESLLNALPLRIIGILKNDTLLAIPFFTFMGLILERSGMAEDLLETIGQVFGAVRGGLAFAVILVGSLLAATTGVVAASVISMALISLPIMMRYGYDRRLASGAIVASGTLAQIVPPSLVLIVIADQVGRSVGDLYKGALMPAMTLIGAYILWILIVTLIRPKAAPALPVEARVFRDANGHSGYTSLWILIAVSTVGAVLYAKTQLSGQSLDNVVVLSMAVGIGIAFVLALINRSLGLITQGKISLLSKMAQQVTFVLIPPLALIFLVLGTIFLGWATPTEGGAMGAVGALVLAAARRRLGLEQLKQAMEATLKLSSFVLFILIGATVFSLSFQGVDGPEWIHSMFKLIPGGMIGFLIFVNLVVFILGFFLDFFEISFIVIPLLIPVATALNIDLVWLGVMLAMNLQTSFLTPPVGFSLFYYRSVAPVKAYLDRITRKEIAPIATFDIYRGVIPFIIIQVIMVGMIIAFPNLVTGNLDKKVEVDLNTIEINVPSGYGAGAYSNDPPKTEEDPMMKSLKGNN